MQSLTDVRSEVDLKGDASPSRRKQKTRTWAWAWGADCETAQHTVWSRDAINSVNEGKHVMTGLQSHWWGWWMAFSSNTWQFITHLRHKHAHTHSYGAFAHRESLTYPNSCSFSPLLTFCITTYAVLHQAFSNVFLAPNHIHSLGKSSCTHRVSLAAAPSWTLISQRWRALRSSIPLSSLSVSAMNNYYYLLPVAYYSPWIDLSFSIENVRNNEKWQSQNSIVQADVLKLPDKSD